MSVGSILVGIALTMVVGVFLAEPFRSARTASDPVRLIEAWVDQVYAETEGMAGEGAEAGAAWDEEEAPTSDEPLDPEAVMFCSQCGRQSSPGDRFCARCGNTLFGGHDEAH